MPTDLITTLLSLMAREFPESYAPRLELWEGKLILTYAYNNNVYWMDDFTGLDPANPEKWVMDVARSTKTLQP